MHLDDMHIPCTLCGLPISINGFRGRPREYCKACSEIRKKQSGKK
tara:strand:+ start:926 stop:1060 length:135 start_codon:yes stop_codon:yes gene_type:complete